MVFAQVRLTPDTTENTVNVLCSVVCESG
jgi:hypothetical protein